jgi:DNA replication and repair protein RecF
MKIISLTLTNYRNYTQQTFNLADGLNVFVGKNAQGKTNAIEAMYFCAIGKSLRTNKDKNLINFEKENAKITLEVQKQFSKVKVEVYLSNSAKKTIKINKIPIKKISDLMGEFNAVFFSPDELKLVKETPEDRRRFMDIDISQTSKEYFHLLQDYSKILASRNKLIKTSNSASAVKETIDIWDRMLAKTASKIILYRVDFLNRLAPFATKTHAYLTDNLEALEIEYAGIFVETQEKTANKIYKKLKDNFEKDMSLGYTSVGPHRDDIKIKLNNIDVRSYGSQGQQRTAALSLKLAELEIMRQTTGETPVLLLDDVLSELDNSRKKKLLALTQKYQTIITGTEFDFKGLNHTIFKIENGSLK